MFVLLFNTTRFCPSVRTADGIRDWINGFVCIKRIRVAQFRWSICPRGTFTNFLWFPIHSPQETRWRYCRDRTWWMLIVALLRYALTVRWFRTYLDDKTFFLPHTLEYIFRNKIYDRFSKLCNSYNFRADTVYICVTHWPYTLIKKCRKSINN